MFSINDFKSKLDRYGGPANPSLFSVHLFNKRPTADDFDPELTFFCHRATLPGINFVTQPHRPDNMGIAQHMPVGIEAQSLECMFIIDDNHKIFEFFHKWTSKVINYSAFNGKYMVRAGTTDHAPYEINYKSEYSKVMVIRHYSLNGETYEMTFDGVYPTDIASLQLSWNDSGAMELPVHFSYSSFTNTSIELGTNPISTRSDGSTTIINDTINKVSRNLDRLSSILGF